MSDPALAVGGWFVVDALTVNGALERNPSLTMSCAVYVPRTSAVNVGVAAVALDSAAALPAGLARSDHA